MGPILVPVRPYSDKVRYDIKAEQRAKSIGGFIGDEFMIAMGDVAKIYKKLRFLAGYSLKKKLKLNQHTNLE